MTGAGLQLTDLTVEVDGDCITVSLPGTKYRALYLRNDDGLIESSVTGESASELSYAEFRTIAAVAAANKAREQGWIG